MSTNLKELFSQKTTEELLDVLRKFEKYTPTAIAVAIDELKSRGYSISEEKLQAMNEVIQKEKEYEQKNKLFESNLRKHIVADPDAPLLYSREAIWWFSVLFGSIFGSMLLALNVDNRKQKIMVISLGVLFSVLAVLSGTFRIGYVFLINSTGAYVLNTVFWKKYIGIDTKYRAKPIWIPLIYTIIISVIILFFAV